MIFVTSWDDGYPADMKVAALLDRYDQAGTFFVPVSNCEGLAVLDKTALRELDSRFEIGSHTLNHVRLNRVDIKQNEREIAGGKLGLENLLGHVVEGFSYPGGCVTIGAVDCLRSLGIRYARTVELFRLDAGGDPFSVPTTIQIFPHRKSAYVRNFISKGNMQKRGRCFRCALTGVSLSSIIDDLLDVCVQTNSIMHVWGHSWEIERYNLWPQLERLLLKARALKLRSMNMMQLINNMTAYP